jgi:hypothetical protein
MNSIIPQAANPQFDPDNQGICFDAATPISFVRSSLFGIRAQGSKGAGKPSYQVDRVIYTSRDVLDSRISYTGPELHQRHMTAWQAVIAAAASRKLSCDASSPLDVPAAELLELMGASTDGRARKELEELLNELTQATIRLDTRLYSYTGHLISDFEAIREVAVVNGKKVVRASRVRIRLNPRMTRLLQNQVNLNTLAFKVTLSRDQLAMRLCDLIASHLTVPKMPVSELKELCGSRVELKLFRYNLRRSMAKLVVAGLVVKWEIDDATDNLIVDKVLTPKHFNTAEVAAARLEKRVQEASGALPVPPAPPTATTLPAAPVASPAASKIPPRALTHSEKMDELRRLDSGLKGMPKWEQDKIIRARMQRASVAL